jgi:hypothetical protein
MFLAVASTSTVVFTTATFSLFQAVSAVNDSFDAIESELSSGLFEDCSVIPKEFSHKHEVDAGILHDVIHG